MERRRAKAEEDEDPEEVADVPVFLLGASEARDGLVAVELTEEFGLVAPGRGPGLRLPQTPADEQAAWTSGVSAVAERAKRPAHDDAYGSLAGPVDTRCRALEREDICERIWARDHTVWREEPAEITDRLGWLDVAWRMRDEAADLQSWADDVRRQGVSQVVLCGMGGSSLAPEMFRAICGGSIPLTVLDSTHPDHVAAVTSSLDPDRTLVIVSSKSGTTVETRSHLEHLWAASGRADRFIAITDPGSQLAEVARARGFRRTFSNPPDIGGRYSALSYFGLVPAAVCGIDVAELCDGAIRSALACAPSVDARRSVGARLGVALGEAWAVDHDKLTLVLPQALRPLGDWIEQLIAESLGKDDTGIVPVVGEDLGPPDVYRDDRLLVAYAIGDEPFGEELDALESDGHPVVRLVVADASPATVGAECFRWEFATAVAGCVIDVQPFDQPDVEAAKQRAREALERPGEPPKASSIDEVLGALEAEDGPSYLALQAFLPPTAEHARMLQAARMKLRDRLRVATTVGFGPRFLHSTGQLHKGGLPGACIQVTGPRSTDVDVPEAGYSFGRLLDAQADGDLQALLDRNRLVARVSLDELGVL
jgi:glucose-6-phosphate isomerase